MLVLALGLTLPPAPAWGRDTGYYCVQICKYARGRVVWVHYGDNTEGITQLAARGSRAFNPTTTGWALDYIRVNSGGCPSGAELWRVPRSPPSGFYGNNELELGTLVFNANSRSGEPGIIHSFTFADTGGNYQLAGKIALSDAGWVRCYGIQ